MVSAQPIALVVEDDNDIRDALEAVATHAGFTAVSVPDGLAALRYLATAEPPPRVILLDLMMPVMDGWQFLARRAAAHASIPIIAITAKADPSLPPDIRLLPKPVSMEAVVAALRPHWS